MDGEGAETVDWRGSTRRSFDGMVSECHDGGVCEAGRGAFGIEKLNCLRFGG